MRLWNIRQPGLAHLSRFLITDRGSLFFPPFFGLEASLQLIAMVAIIEQNTKQSKVERSRFTGFTPIELEEPFDRTLGLSKGQKVHG